MSFSLCRRLPSEHVSGQLQFKVELTSTGPDGKSALNSICPHFYFFKNNFPQNIVQAAPSVAGASPDSIIGLSSLNGAPGTPSDDEDLPHHLPVVASSSASPTGSQGSQSMWEGGAMALPEKDLSLIGAECKFIGPESLSAHEMLQRSIVDGPDAIEAPKGRGERPLGAASPKLRSSFPTHTRLSAMLHIDSDEDEDRSSANDIIPVSLSPLLMNGKPPDVGGADEDDPFPELLEEEPEDVGGGAEDALPDAGLVLELGEGLDLEDVLEPDVFSEVDEAPFTDAVSHNALPEGGEVNREGRGPGEEPSSEIDTCSMATAPQTVFSSSESCPITLTTAVVSSRLHGEPLETVLSLSNRPPVNVLLLWEDDITYCMFICYLYNLKIYYLHISKRL